MLVAYDFLKGREHLKRVTGSQLLTLYGVPEHDGSFLSVYIGAWLDHI